MKVLKYFLGVCIVITIHNTFVSCSSDPITENKPESEQNGIEESKESLYKPFATEKFISKLVEEKIFTNNSYQREYSYENYDLSYDDKGRVKEYLHYFIYKERNEETYSDTSIYRVNYIGDTIVIRADFGYYTDNIITELSENGYDASQSINEEGYRTSYYMDGYKDGTCKLYYENGNLVKETTPIGSYAYEYTQYLNDASLDLSCILVSIDGSIQIPSDLMGKRSKNLPDTKKAISSMSRIESYYTYSFDSKGRVIKIIKEDSSDLSGDRVDKTYYIEYED